MRRRLLWILSPAFCVVLCPLNPALPQEQEDATGPEEFRRLMKERYDGKIVIPVVAGLYAGEFKKGFVLGPGEMSLYWHHYHSTVPVPNRITSKPLSFSRARSDEMHRIDDRTFGDLAQGLNITKIDKGEELKVHKFYIRPSFIDLVLMPTSLDHVRDIDMSKASTRTRTTITGRQANRSVSVAGFGLAFRFHFDKDVLKAGDYKTVVAEMNKYLLPREEAAKTLNAEKNVEIDLGMTEEAVIQKLGQPLKSIRVGAQKSLKYQDMTVILKDGKVADVKLE